MPIASGAVPLSMTERSFWIQERTGNIGDLRLRNDTLQRPAPGEARVAVKAVGLNFADVFTALGLYSAAPKTDVTPGLEFSGVVEELGALHDNEKAMPANDQQGSQFRVGDRVMGVTRFGGFTNHINAQDFLADKVELQLACPINLEDMLPNLFARSAVHMSSALQSSLLLPIPPAWNFQEGAGAFVQGLTAMYGLRNQGSLAKNPRVRQAVLVHSGAGGCGQYALGICHAYGALPFTTVGTASKVEYLRARFPWLSEDRIIVRDSSRFASQIERVLEAYNLKGFDIILDAVAGDFFMPGFNSLAPSGRYVVYGASNWTPAGDRPGWLRLATQYWRRPRIDPIQMIGQNRSVMAFNLIYLFDKSEELRDLVLELLGLDLPPPTIAAEFDFTEAPAALRHLQSGNTTGKVVLNVRD